MRIIKAEPLYRHLFHNLKIDLLDSLLFKPEKQEPGFNLRMFNEDFARLILPYNQRDNDLFKIVTNDKELLHSLLNNVKTGFRSISIDNNIRHFVEEIAQSLVWYGKAYYYIHNDVENDDIIAVSFSSAGVFNIFSSYIQWVPKHIERQWGREQKVCPREIRILDSAKLMHFEMPISIKRMISHQNNTLRTLDKHQFNDVYTHSHPTHDNPNPKNYFDFNMWRDTKDFVFYRATRRTGWNGRNYDSSKRSDFFDCHRLIRFRKNQILLRDTILSQLSNEISRVGQSFKADFSVKISESSELPSIAEFNKLEDKLEREEVGFKEIIDFCYKA